MVIEDRCHPVPNAVQNGCIRTGPGAVQGKMTVDRPPGSVQHLKEIGRIIADDREASGQTGIDMRMRIDQSGHDHSALRINKLRIRICPLKRIPFPDRQDLRTLRDDGAVPQIRIFRISCDHLSVTD